MLYLDFVKFLVTFDWFQGSPLWGVGVGGWGWDSVRVFGGCPMHVCTCTYMHAFVCVWAMMSYRDSPGFPYGRSHLHEIIMFIHVCTCTYMCACVCACTHAWGTPLNTLTESHPHPPTPTPPKGGPWNQSTVNKIWRIKIFEFCLKILDLWTFVHWYRLHLVCRWGVSYHK